MWKKTDHEQNMVKNQTKRCDNFIYNANSIDAHHARILTVVFIIHETKQGLAAYSILVSQQMQKCRELLT